MSKLALNTVKPNISFALFQTNPVTFYLKFTVST